MRGGRKRPRVPSPHLPPSTKDPKEEAEVASLACFSSNPAQSITEPRGDQDLFCISSYLGRLRVKTDPPFNTIPAITYPYGFLPGCFSSRPLSNKEFLHCVGMKSNHRGTQFTVLWTWWEENTIWGKCSVDM